MSDILTQFRDAYNNEEIDLDKLFIGRFKYASILPNQINSNAVRHVFLRVNYNDVFAYIDVISDIIYFVGINNKHLQIVDIEPFKDVFPDVIRLNKLELKRISKEFYEQEMSNFRGYVKVLK